LLARRSGRRCCRRVVVIVVIVVDTGAVDFICRVSTVPGQRGPPRQIERRSFDGYGGTGAEKAP
jgi:hypothetical protein